MSRNMHSKVQVAHFLEADMQPWEALLAAALFAASPSAALREAAWRHLDELAPLGDTIGTVLRASRLPLRQQLPLTPPEWQPAVISSHAVAGTLTLDFAEAAACCDAMRAVQQLHTLNLELSPKPDDRGKAAEKIDQSREPSPRWHRLRTVRGVTVLLQVRAAVASQPALRSLSVRASDADSDGLAMLVPALSRLSQLSSLTWSHDVTCDREEFEHTLGAIALAPQLRRFTALTALDLGDNYFGKAGMEVLAPAFSCLVHLERLSLQHNNLGVAGAGALAQPLQQLTTLTALDLSRNQMDEWAVQALAPALSCLVRLQDLALHRNWVGDEGAAMLSAPLRHLTTLTALYLGTNEIFPDGIASLAPSLSRLAHLDLYDNYMAAECGGADPPAWTCLPHLVSVNLRNNRFWHSAPRLRLLTALTALDLSYSGMKADGMMMLAPDLRFLSRLAHLNLECTGLLENWAVALAPALSCLRQLEHLNLCDASLHPADAAALAPALGHLTALTALDLSGAHADEESAASLAPALCHLTRLASLNLRSHVVGRLRPAATPHEAAVSDCRPWSSRDDGSDPKIFGEHRALCFLNVMGSLAPALALLTALTALDLQHNFLGVIGAEALAPALSRLSRLASLDLSGNEIGAAGAAALSPPLSLLTALTRLDVRGNKIDVAGAEALAPAISRLSRLASLDLGYNCIGATDAAALVRAGVSVTKLLATTGSGASFQRLLTSQPCRD